MTEHPDLTGVSAKDTKDADFYHVRARSKVPVVDLVSKLTEIGVPVEFHRFIDGGYTHGDFRNAKVPLAEIWQELTELAEKRHPDADNPRELRARAVARRDRFLFGLAKGGWEIKDLHEAGLTAEQAVRAGYSARICRLIADDH